jgi:multidrug resistance efflux pump
MASRTSIRMVALGLIVVAAGVGAYWLSRPASAPIVGVVRTTEVRIAPEVGGLLTAIKVRKGNNVSAGEVVAELSAIELTASVGQARAALDAATADRNNVYAGVRAEQVASRKAEIAKAKSRLEYAEQQVNRTETLARTDNASQQGSSAKRCGERTRRRRRGDSQLRRRNRRADERGARHCGRAGQSGGVGARRARAAARQDNTPGAGRRNCQRGRC